MEATIALDKVLFLLVLQLYFGINLSTPTSNYGRIKTQSMYPADAWIVSSHMAGYDFEMACHVLLYMISFGT